MCCREEDANSPSSTSFVRMDKVATDPAPATTSEETLPRSYNAILILTKLVQLYINKY